MTKFKVFLETDVSVFGLRGCNNNIDSDRPTKISLHVGRVRFQTSSASSSSGALPLRIGNIEPLASPRGGLGCNCPPSVPRMGREIRANPMSFLGGTPYVVVWHFSLKVLFSCYNVCFLFKDANCALHSFFRNKDNPHVLCFSYLERWVKIG